MHSWLYQQMALDYFGYLATSDRHVDYCWASASDQANKKYE